jgi:hypothetical protein
MLKHARLLRRQRLQALDEIGNLGIDLDAEFDAGRRGDAAASTVPTAPRISSMLADLEMKPDAPSSSARRIGLRSSCAETTTSGADGIDAAQRDQARTGRCAWHGEVEQHEVDILMIAETSDFALSKSPASRYGGDVANDPQAPASARRETADDRPRSRTCSLPARRPSLPRLLRPMRRAGFVRQLIA